MALGVGPHQAICLCCIYVNRIATVKCEVFRGRVVDLFASMVVNIKQCF